MLSVKLLIQGLFQIISSIMDDAILSSIETFFKHQGREADEALQAVTQALELARTRKAVIVEQRGFIREFLLENVAEEAEGSSDEEQFPPNKCDKRKLDFVLL